MSGYVAVVFVAGIGTAVLFFVGAGALTVLIAVVEEAMGVGVQCSSE